MAIIDFFDVRNVSAPNYSEIKYPELDCEHLEEYRRLTVL